MPKRITKKKEPKEIKVNVPSETIIKEKKPRKTKLSFNDSIIDTSLGCSGTICSGDIDCHTKKEPKKKNKIEEVSDKIEDIIEDVIIEPGKYILHSKVIWANIIAFILFLIQQKHGFVFDVDIQAEILIIVNMVLRGFTGNGLRLK